MESVFARRRHLLGVEAGRRRHRHGRADRVDADHHLRVRDGAGDGRRRDRRAPHRREGSRRRRARRRAGDRARASALAVVVGVVGALRGAPPAGGDGRVARASIAIGSRFTRVMLGGSVTVILLFLINAAFRGAGDPAIAMRTLWLANGINIVLGPLLVFGVGPFPRLGVTGAAVATTIGRGIGVLYQLRALRAGRGHLRRRAASTCASTRGVMATILRLSGTGIFQILHRHDQLGRADAIVAALRQRGGRRLRHRHPRRAVRAAAVVGHGQRGGDAGGPEPGRRPARARRAGGVARGALQPRVPGLHRAWCSSCSAAASCARSRTIPGRRRTGRPRCASSARASCSTLTAWCVTQAFNGAGDTRTPTLINLFCFWLLEIPLAWLLAKPLGPRPDGRVHRRAGRLLDDGGRQRRAVPARPLEARGGLTVWWGTKCSAGCPCTTRPGWV